MDDEQTADFFSPPEDAPIVLGGEEEGFDFAAPPSDEPIVLMAPEPVEDFGGAVMVEDVEEEDEPVESSPMAKWNEEWTVTLLGRKDHENAVKAEHVEAARADMEKIQAQRDIKRESKMARNRGDEQEKLEAIEADLENDNSWQRACKLVELTADSEEGAVDVSRMKDVMILLKNDTTRAATLAA